MINPTFVFGLGFIAQGLFSARLLVQWLLSEKAKKVLSPDIFWQLSMVASFLLLVYGILRKDIVLIGGQFVSYYIYIRNLHLKRNWKTVFPLFRWIIISAPVFSLALLVFNKSGYSLEEIVDNPEISVQLFTVGTIGQMIFTFRFVYQIIYSERKKQSLLPPVFWIISITGALIIAGYAIARNDPVIILGQLSGILIYSRNLFLHYFVAAKQKKIKNI
ncbi:lipid-A-disaccharide synthase N-terminal domain-containing protein [Thermophagus sp. OGC60D27]|uniref:lipid-A-disaccharide synthase N-terminal domain-containing protein n=1 Tax=Thermophagus sp. OGC60D27 TaxID=3458415 RepID=UPI004037C73C